MTATARRALLLAPAGKTGHLNQCIGIAERLGIPFAIAEIPREGPVRRLVSTLARKRRDGPEVPADGAAIVIASGRQALSPARAIARRLAPRPFVVFLGATRATAGAFDLAWAPAHDGLCPGERLIVTPTSPGRVTPEGLAAAAEALGPRLAGLPRPRIAVLVGGQSRAYRFGTTEAEELGSVLAGFSRANEASLMVTPSRRTGAAATAILEEKLAGPRTFFWDGAGESPLAGMLGLADATVVTCDSVNMLSEAALTGRPVYAWPLPGGRAKFDRFHAALEAAGAMRWFDGTLATWRYRPLDPAAEIAAAIARRLG